MGGGPSPQSPSSNPGIHGGLGSFGADPQVGTKYDKIDSHDDALERRSCGADGAPGHELYSIGDSSSCNVTEGNKDYESSAFCSTAALQCGSGGKNGEPKRSVFDEEDDPFNNINGDCEGEVDDSDQPDLCFENDFGDYANENPTGTEIPAEAEIPTGGETTPTFEILYSGVDVGGKMARALFPLTSSIRSTCGTTSTE